MTNSVSVEASIHLPAGAAPRSASARAEIEQLKGIFLTSLNHEIRTPLSGILGMTDMLLETQLDEEQRDYVQAARLCAENLFEILNATLEYAAMEAGQCSLDDSEFSLRELLQSALEQHALKAANKGLKLVSTIDTGLPETVIGDAPRLRQLLGHLLANAVKFTPAGSVELHAFPEADSELEWLVVEVRDTGIGIAPDHLDTIFESFRQVDSGLSRSYAGMGLGLALVQKMAGLMHGAVTVESRVGVGSTFTLRVPLRRYWEPPVEAQPPERGARGPAILAVEDNPVGLLVLRRALDRRGQVVYASSAREAIEIASRCRFDLILMDLQMPEMDGLEATAILREIPGYENVPILALTANSSDELREQCRLAGMQAFLSKPVDAASLWAAVSRFV
ncbi:MAG TPA: ATP-binding protein [Bryobacteraceae bacterium]|nr:ATP-binding protein [Bryobacteraceae bacterium]